MHRSSRQEVEVSVLVVRVRVTSDRTKTADQPERRHHEALDMMALVLSEILCIDALRAVAIVAARLDSDLDLVAKACLVGMVALWLMSGHRLG